MSPHTFVLMLCISFASGAQADGIGRLFFTPQQRTQLEHEYARNHSAKDSDTSVLIVNGIVQREGGTRTVWINGKAQTESNSGERSPAVQSVTVPGKAHPVKIKVGQRLVTDKKPLPQSGSEERD